MKDFNFLENINCLYTNADQLRNKLDELRVRIRDTVPKIIGITKVKPKNSVYKLNSAEFSLDEIADYDMFTFNIEKTLVVEWYTCIYISLFQQ